MALDPEYYTEKDKQAQERADEAKAFAEEAKHSLNDICFVCLGTELTSFPGWRICKNCGASWDV